MNALASLPPYMPLRRAARFLGVSCHTMRRWLERDCGLVFHAMGRGRQPLVSRDDLQRVVDARTGSHDWSVARTRKAS